MAGTVTVQQLEEARREAKRAWDQVKKVTCGVYQASHEELQKARAWYIARAATLLAGVGAQSDDIGVLAREAVDAAFSAACFNPGAHIAAKVLGRRREADLLAYLEVGTPHEREAIREGKTVTGGSRRVGYAMGVVTGEPVDLSNVPKEGRGDA